ncbi:MAG TPA: hypothetical protein IAC15_05040 [Candidatus Onthomonas avicola]|nr:hypothetical protein [Candidatus Onthomonas avicola]
MSEKKTTFKSRTEKRRAPAPLRILLRVLTVVLSLLLVAAGVLLVLHRDKINLDALARYLTYYALERSEDGQGADFFIDRYTGGRYAALGDNLLAYSSNTAQIYSGSGSVYEDLTLSLSEPVAQTAGSYAVLYDSGGGDLYLFSARELLWHYETQSDLAILSARVNDAGWLAVVEQASGYKGAVTVYDAAQEPVVTENISSRFVYDAAVSPDNRSLAVVTIGQEGADFTSAVTVYSCADGTETASASFNGTLPLDLRWDGDGVWLQERRGMRLLDAQCQELASWSESSLYLQAYSLQGEGFAVEYLSRSSASAVGQLFVIDGQGQVTGTLEVTEEVLSVTAAGRYIAVLTSSALTIYTSDLEEYAVLENTDGIRQALVRSDGSAFLVMEETARVYLP